MSARKRTADIARLAVPKTKDVRGTFSD